MIRQNFLKTSSEPLDLTGSSLVLLFPLKGFERRRLGSLGNLLYFFLNEHYADNSGYNRTYTLLTSYD